MTIRLLGKKCGMTRVFTEEGVAVPVTVIEILPNRVTQIKTLDKDGYKAIQVTMGQRKRTHITKAEAGHFAKAGVEPGVKLLAFRLSDQEDDNQKGEGLGDITVGSELKLDIFTVGQFVDVTSVTKGKGFAGTIKRHHFSAQDATHGNSVSHRVPGSIGQRQSPGKVFKGKKMAGHLGDVQRTILSQQIIRVDLERQIILIKGAVPGAQNAWVMIRPAIKKSA
jgi:large subunit ribosomal protein L3